jgi:tetratricopeptide (TPR) repeat protein
VVGQSRQQAHQFLASLRRVRLQKHFVQFHDLLRAYAVELAEAEESGTARTDAFHRILDHYLHTAIRAALLVRPHRDPLTLTTPVLGVRLEDVADRDAALAWYTAEYPVLLGVIARAEGARFDVHIWQMAWACAEFFERQGKWHVQLTVQHAALAAAERIADRVGEAHAHRGLGMGYARLARYHEANGYCQKALALMSAIGDRFGQAATYDSIGYAQHRLGDHDAAIEAYLRAIDLCREAGNRYQEAATLTNLGDVYQDSGDSESARRAWRLALGQLDELGHADAARVRAKLAA